MQSFVAHPALVTTSESDEPAETLDVMQPGQSARIQSVSGDSATRRRLLEMGLCRGTLVHLVRRAPFGDPIELRVRGYLLSLRTEQARLIGIEKESFRP
jgi:ferrous iron transport protein A